MLKRGILKLGGECCRWKLGCRTCGEKEEKGSGEREVGEEGFEICGLTVANAKRESKRGEERGWWKRREGGPLS